MSLFKDLFNIGANKIKNKRSDLDDHLQVSKASYMANISGAWTGSSAYNNLRSSAQSYFARELLDTNASREKFKLMHKSMKKFGVYADPNALSKLFVKYSDDPKRLSEKTDYLMKNALEQLNIFTSNYQELIQIIHDELVKNKNLMSVDEDFLNKTFNRVFELQMQKHVYFPEEILVKAKEKFITAFKDEMSRLDQDLNEDQKVTHGVQIKRGLFSRFLGSASTGYWSHKAKKTVKKLQNIENKELVQNFKILNDELNSGQVSPVTFARLIKHAKSFKQSQKLIEEIGHDARAFLGEADKMCQDMIEKNNKFLAMLRTSKNVSEAMAKLDELKKDHDAAISVATSDSSDTQKLRDYLNQINNNLSNYFSTFSEVSRNVIKEMNGVKV